MPQMSIRNKYRSLATTKAFSRQLHTRCGCVWKTTGFAPAFAILCFPPNMLIWIQSIRFGFVFCCLNTALRLQRQQHHFQNVINSIDPLKRMTNSRCAYFTWFYGVVTSLLQQPLNSIYWKCVRSEKLTSTILIKVTTTATTTSLKMKMNDFQANEPPMNMHAYDFLKRALTKDTSHHLIFACSKQ